MYSHAICMSLICYPYVTRMSSVYHSYLLVCHSYVSHIYSYVICMESIMVKTSRSDILVYTNLLIYEYYTTNDILVHTNHMPVHTNDIRATYEYIRVTMYLYVTRVSPICTRMSFVCHSYVVLP